MQRSRKWDAEAARFDEEADHGLIGEARAAWARLLQRCLPPAPSAVADLGCGTGSLTVLLAEQGHRVTGVDFSTEMLERARAKATEHGVDVRLELGDAGAPPLPAGAFDVVLTRHVLWDLPEPAAAIQRWATLLRAGGRFVLVEGNWLTGAGLTADQVVDLVRPHTGERSVEALADPHLWGGPISDERFAVTASVADRALAPVE